MQNNNQNVLTNDQKDEGLKVWDGPEIDEEHDDREVAVKVEHVTMRFTLSREKVDNLKEFAIKFLKHQLVYNNFVALNDISFEVKKGDRLAIL